MAAVDTNVLIRLIVRDNDAQVRLAEEFVANGAWISHLVLAESAWVLQRSYGVSHDHIAGIGEGLLEQQKITIQDPEVVRAALSVYRLRPSLGFGDCLILEIARKAGHVPLGTFDRALAKVHGATRIG